MTARKPSATSPGLAADAVGTAARSLDRSPLDIEIADIAHGLARVARWNGQTSGAHIFSVAQHTLLVEAVMREQTPRVDASLRLAALLHDAPGYVIGDMISPFKAVLGGDYKGVENGCWRRSASASDCRRCWRTTSRRRSRPPIGGGLSQATELAGFAQAEAKRLFGRIGLPAAMQQDYLTPWTAAKVEKRFWRGLRHCARRSPCRWAKARLRRARQRRHEGLWWARFLCSPYMQ
jgi:5'-deoxynucleotidase YfbR-like HD superfamily hydrolase